MALGSALRIQQTQGLWGETPFLDLRGGVSELLPKVPGSSMSQAKAGMQNLGSGSGPGPCTQNGKPWTILFSFMSAAAGRECSTLLCLSLEKHPIWGRCTNPCLGGWLWQTLWLMEFFLLPSFPLSQGFILPPVLGLVLFTGLKNCLRVVLWRVSMIPCRLQSGWRAAPERMNQDIWDHPTPGPTVESPPSLLGSPRLFMLLLGMGGGC